MADEHPATAAEAAATHHRRRRWPWVIAAGLVLLAAAALWVAGPGFEVVGERVLRRELARAGLVGDYSLKEMDATGFRMRDLDLTGPGLVRSVTGEEVAVEYRLGELRRGRIRSLRASNFEVVLDLDAAPQRDAVRFDADALGQTLRTVQAQLGPVDMTAENVTIRIVRGDETVTTIRGADIRHVAETERFHVAFEEIGSAGGEVDGNPNDNPEDEPPPVDPVAELLEEAPRQQVEITWGAEGLMIDRLEVLPGIVLEQVELRHAEDEPMRAESVARIAGGTVRVRLEENLRVGRLQLEEGTIDLATLMERIGQDPRLAGSVDALDMTIENILQPPGMWSGTGSASAPVVELDELRLDEVALTLEKQAQTAAVTLAAGWWGTSVELAAQADFRQALEEDPARWWHGAGLGGTLESADLAPALAELRRRRDPDATEAPVPQARLAVGFTASLVGSEWERAAAEFHLRDLAVNGRTLPPLAGEVVWDAGAGSIDATASHRNDGEMNLQASWTFASERYRGSANFEQYDLAALAGFLQPFDLQAPSGTLTGSWSGSGIFADTDRHAGAIRLQESLLEFPGRPTLAGTIDATYDWPGEVAMEQVRIEQNGSILELSGRWSEGEVVLEQVSVLGADEELLLSGRVRAPMAPEVRSLDGFFAQDGEISARFEASDLSIAQIRDLVPGLEPPATGTISGTVEIGGTLAEPVTDATLNLRGMTLEVFPELVPTDVALILQSAGGRLEVDSVLLQEGEAILGVVADLPLSAGVRSLEDFLGQEEEISIRLETTDFPVDQLQQFLPEDFIDLPESGRLDGEVTVTGTFDEPTVAARIEARDL